MWFTMFVMAVPTIVLPEVRNALSRAAGRLADLLRSLPDTRATIPGSRWTAGDAAAHVVMELRTEALVAAGEAVSWAQGATSVPGTPRGAAELRGGPRAVIRFTNGHASLEQPGTAPVDCHILAAPVTLLLVLYGRTPQWGPIAKGQLLSWGRRPWRAVGFKQLFLDP